MQFDVDYATDIGQKRSQNQDNLGSLPELGLFIVADGMGGHRGGEIASAMAVEIISNSVREAQKSPKWNPRQTITEAIRLANSAIFKKASENSQLQGMGTTTTALLFKENFLTIGHVGDSRCYYFTPEAMWQATRDHSLVQERLRAGMINREEAKTDRMKNVITRSVGFEPAVDVEIYEMKVETGDIFMICSDGLTGLVDEPELFEIISRHAAEPFLVRTAMELTDTANRNGGDDNISAVVVRLLGETH